MIYTRKIFLLIICFCFSFPLVSCKNKNQFENSKLVGIAIYQNVEGNENWNNIKQNPERANNLIKTKNNEIIYDEESPFLFYIYNKNDLCLTNLNQEDFETNTKIKNISFENETLNFNFERIVENTDLIVYFVFKLDNGKYYLKYKQSFLNIQNEESNFEINCNINEIKSINLTLTTDGTIKETY